MPNDFDDSDHPLLKAVTLTISAIADYQELLTIETDPTRIQYVGHIKIDINDATSIPYINIWLDGKQYFKDIRIINTSLTIDFGRHVKLNRVSKPIVIQIKKTAAGTGALVVTAFVDGIEKY